MKKVLAVIFLVLCVAASGFSRVGGGDVLFSLKKAGNATFSHENHVAGADLSCTACHPSPYVTSKKHGHTTMADMQKGKSCGACHNGKEAFSVKVKADCNRCHAK
jgi:c(7)-type cytochrome triheme protein